MKRPTAAPSVSLTEDRIQIVYGVDHDDNDSTASHVRLARLAEKNAVYLERTWHIRTIAENVYDAGSDSLNLEFDNDSRTHIFFRQTGTQGLHHLWFNKAFWNHTLLDEGPIGSDIEISIDSLNMFHIVYTIQPENGITESEVRLFASMKPLNLDRFFLEDQSISKQLVWT